MRTVGIINLFHKHKVSAVLLCALVLIGVDDFSQHQVIAENSYPAAAVLYNRNTAADQQIINVIERAQRYVYFAMYTITKQNIADALVAAKMRGLDVRGILDFNQSLIPQEKPIIAKLRSYGIGLQIPFKATGLMHIKMLVSDNSYASGSFNWTFSATSLNDEVIEIGRNEDVRRQYLAIFQQLSATYKQQS